MDPVLGGVGAALIGGIVAVVNTVIGAIWLRRKYPDESRALNATTDDVQSLKISRELDECLNRVADCNTRCETANHRLYDLQARAAEHLPACRANQTTLKEALALLAEHGIVHTFRFIKPSRLDPWQ